MNTAQRSVKRMSILIVAAVLLLGATLVTAAYKSRRPMVETFNQGVSVFDDFLTSNSNTDVGEYTGLYFNSTVSGGTVVRGSSETYPGFVRLTVGNDTDRACVNFVSTLYLDNSSMLVAETRFQLDTLLTSGHSTEMYFGFGLFTGQNLASMSNAVVFTYDRSVSDNFRIYHKASSVVTQEVLDYPVVAETDYYLKIILAGTKAVFLINNVMVGSLDLSISDGVPLVPIWFLEKNDGSALAQDLTVDAVGVYQQFIDPRIFSNTVVTQ